MSDHSKAFVPIETWCYSSPELRYSGKTVDIGLMAESLIYYDNIFLNVVSQQEFAELLQWFLNQNRYDKFLSLIKDGVITIYHYAFATAPIEKGGTYFIINLQDEEQKSKNTFIERFVYHKIISDVLNKDQQNLLANAIEGNIIEVKADNFGKPIKNAGDDYLDANRCSLILQCLIDEVYPFIGWGKGQKINVTIEKNGSLSRINWNFSLKNFSDALGKNLNFHKGTPLAAAAICNRILWTTSQIKCDAYLGNPMSSLIGDKLYEATRKTKGIEGIISNLKTEVEFPDIRFFVNNNRLNIDNVLKIRKEANKFRYWLQTEGERDRNAIIAYHNEVARDSGISKLGRKTLKLFGILGSPVAGAIIGGAVGNSNSAIVGGVAGASLNYICDLGAQLGTGWKPVIFGNWLDTYIKDTLSR